MHLEMLALSLGRYGLGVIDSTIEEGALADGTTGTFMLIDMLPPGSQALTPLGSTDTGLICLVNKSEQEYQRLRKKYSQTVYLSDPWSLRQYSITPDGGSMLHDVEPIYRCDAQSSTPT